MAKCVYRDAPKKIQILAAIGIVKMATAAVREHHRRTAIGVEKEARFAIADVVCVRGAAQRYVFLFHCMRAAPCGATAEEWSAGRTRVPREKLPVAAESNDFGRAPPMIRTSEIPAASARLAASSFKIIPPETLLLRIRFSISPLPITRSTFSPSSTPSTSVRKIRRSACTNSAAAAAI